MTVVLTLARWSPTEQDLARWAAAEPALAGRTGSELLAVLHDRAVAPDIKDDVLAALLRVARHDVAAVSMLVVSLLPGLRVLANRLGRSAPVDDVWSELLLQFTAHVRRYDLNRRPRRIAANLLLDSFSHTLTWVQRERRWQASRTDLDEASFLRTEDPAASSIVSDALRQGVLTPDDATLLVSTHVGGFALAEGAQLLGLNYEAAKKRRQRAQYALSAWLVSEQLSA